MKNTGGYKQILTSIMITVIVITGFYIFKYEFVLPRIRVDNYLSLITVGVKYFFFCLTYLISILLANTILMYFFKQIKRELLSLSFASSYLLIILSAFVIGFIELNNFDFIVFRVID